MKMNLALKSLFVVVTDSEFCNLFGMDKYKVTVTVTDNNKHYSFQLYSGNDVDVVNKYIAIYNIKNAMVEMVNHFDGIMTAFHMWE